MGIEDTWIAAGLYDQSAPDAAERRELLEFLRDVGCSLEEMIDAERRGRLFALAGDRAIRGGSLTFSFADIASKLECDIATVQQLWRALGFEEPISDDQPIATDADLDGIRTAHLIVGILGADRGHGVLRTYGAALSRVADAASAAFRTVGDISVQRSGSAITTAKAWLGIADIVTDVARLLDVTHRHHVDTSRRHFEDTAAEFQLTSIDELRVAVGFADLSGFTALSHTLPADELTKLLAGFESTTFDLARSNRCRVVKFIGDAVMVVSSNATALAGFAQRLTAEVKQPLSVRAGLAFGDVVAREGDYFGTAVNLAARLIAIAPPGAIVVPASFLDLLPDTWGREPMPPAALRGFDEAVSVYTITGPGGDG